MDPQKKDQTRNRPREEALARRVGEALDQVGQLDQFAPRECPDAGMIAAFHERALSAQESAQCESHFANCSRCRNVLAVLAAVDDTPLAETEISHLGQLVAAGSATGNPTAIHRPGKEIPAGTSSNVKPIRAGGFPVPDAEERIRVLGWRRRWLAPAIGIAAVLAVWFAMRPPWRTPERSASEVSPQVIVAEGPKQNPGSNPDEIGGIAAPQAYSANREPSSNNNVRSDNAQAPQQAAAPSRTKTFGAAGGAVAPEAAPTPFSDQVSGTRALDSITSLDKKEKQTEADNKIAAQAVVVAPQAKSPALSSPNSVQQSVTATGEAPPIGVSGAPTPAKSQSAARQAQTNEQGAARSSADLPPSTRTAGRNAANLSLAQAAREFAVQLKAPSGAVLWRAGIGGAIERSTDAGRSWTSQVSPLQDDWLAGAAVNDTTCWLVGRNGAVARTMDGEHWEQTAPIPIDPGSGGKLADWGVTARDAQNATITSNAGTRFVTQDGGKTWRRQ